MTEPANTDQSAFSKVQNRLLLECYRHFKTEKLQIPTIPDVAFKIRKAINDPSANNSKIAKVVQIDPTITARLIRIANSPLYRGRRTIESCPEALTRMGLKAAQDIITSFALKTVFQAKTPLVRKRMAELWHHSSYVAAISAVFAHKLRGFDPDKAMLAGLIHDIGTVPILTFVDSIPGHDLDLRQLQETIRLLRVEIGVFILQQWDFGEDFQDVVRHAEHWRRDSGGSADYADIVMLSQLHSYIGKVDSKKLPQLDMLPAFQKLMSGQFDIDTSISILDEAQDEIEHIRTMLN
ncbi:MAG: HDOD domain-containing protein [Methylococcales bacterium]|nr:HDOD domain-containing protein [Methylococcales bacterium]